MFLSFWLPDISPPHPATHPFISSEHRQPCARALTHLLTQLIRSQVWGFETLTSEQRRQGGEVKDKGKADRDLLYRKRGRVYPETGCALDNLTL